MVASVVVDGLVLPVRVGGQPALDFCNTRAGWGSPTPKEYLHSYPHLALWAREAGLTPTAVTADHAAGALILGRALALRDALYDLLVGDATTDSWATVNAEVSQAYAAARLHPAGPDPTGVDPDRTGPASATGASGPDGGRWIRPGSGTGAQARWVLPGADPAAPLFAVAWSAGALLTSVPAGGVLACPGAGCGWLFHDPRGRRRWCSMAWCGNRAKVRRHADRHRPTS
jgi:predicted RNA-binding Zn ribbon-like protein